MRETYDLPSLATLSYLSNVEETDLLVEIIVETTVDIA